MRIGRLRTLAVMLVLAGAAGTGLAGWLAGARTVTLPDAPVRLDCASYVPPRFDAGAGAVLRSELDTQLALVARHFSYIRTYSSEGVADLPDAARRSGLKVMLGAWISSHGPTNRREIERTVALANAHRDVIDSIIVGNEVFLRGDLPAGELATLITEVGNRTGLPVTTADIWAFWPGDPALLASVSFVTVHILPYWDDEPASPERAMEHVAAVYADLQVRFAGHEVRIGETGWPTAGRQRGALAPGRVNAARYLREFTAWASARGIRYNLIEAFDQPWKRTHEGRWPPTATRGNGWPPSSGPGPAGLSRGRPCSRSAPPFTRTPPRMAINGSRPGI